MERPPLASNQLDSSLLDTELHRLLIEKLNDAFLRFDATASIYKRYDLEVGAVLRAAAFVACTGVDRPSPGMVMQGLKFHEKLGRR